VASRTGSHERVRSLVSTTPRCLILCTVTQAWKQTFKLCLITWKTLHTAHPLYLSELIIQYSPPTALHSSNTNLLARPSGITSNLPLRHFLSPHHPPGNHCPHVYIRSLDKLSTFKRQLKAYLFQLAFAV